jgi:hypothetical protein
LASIAIMIVGGIVALVYGVNAEGQSLEDVATPLNAGRRAPPGRRVRARPAPSDCAGPLQEGHLHATTLQEGGLPDPLG